MKSLHFLCLATILCSLSTTAQITKGNFMVGCNGSFYKYTIKNESGNEVQSGTQIILQPNIGYFFINNLAAGLNTVYTYSKSKGGNSSSGYGFGPFVRYYFLESEQNINVLLEASYNYSSGFSNPDFTTTYSLKTGPVIYFNSSVGLELLASYNRNYYSNDSYKEGVFQFVIGLQVHLDKNN